MLTFFFIALYLGASGGPAYQVVAGGASFAQCHAAAVRAEIAHLPFGEESPVTSECFAQEAQ